MNQLFLKDSEVMKAGELKLENLSKEQVAVIYKERLVVDFPKDEQKPLSVIHSAMDQGIYECFGLMDGEEIVGYVFLVSLEGEYLVDYVAVNPAVRNQGLGSELLRQLLLALDGANSLILEVEDPDKAKTPEERSLQTRRYEFYLRNHFCDTGVRVSCFGVPFRILAAENVALHARDELLRLYHMHYRAVLPPNLYEGCIQE